MTARPALARRAVVSLPCGLTPPRGQASQQAPGCAPMFGSMWTLPAATLLLVLQAQAPAAEAQRPPAALLKAERIPPGPVEAEMQNVLYHVDDRVVLRISHLRGALLPTKEDAPPWFDDPRSFSLAIDSGEVAIDPASLSALLNRYVFNYDGSPITGVEVSI